MAKFEQWIAKDLGGFRNGLVTLWQLLRSSILRLPVCIAQKFTRPASVIFRQKKRFIEFRLSHALANSRSDASPILRHRAQEKCWSFLSPSGKVVTCRQLSITSASSNGQDFATASKCSFVRCESARLSSRTTGEDSSNSLERAVIEQSAAILNCVNTSPIH